MYGSPDVDFCAGLHVTTLYGRPSIFCDFTVALFAAAPMRKPHGVAQICICWTHAGVAAVIICSYVPIGGSGPPRTAAGGTLFLASDTLLALEKFGGLHLPAHDGLVMATYTSAQALLASYEAVA